MWIKKVNYLIMDGLMKQTDIRGFLRELEFLFIPLNSPNKKPNLINAFSPEALSFSCSTVSSVRSGCLSGFLEAEERIEWERV